MLLSEHDICHLKISRHGQFTPQHRRYNRFFVRLGLLEEIPHPWGEQYLSCFRLSEKGRDFLFRLDFADS